MFYLKVFFENLLDNRVNGIIFLLLITSLIFLVNNDNIIQSFVAKRFVEDGQKVHFKVALPDDFNAISVIKKMREIPGVVGAYQKDGRKIKKEVDKNLKENNIYIPNYILNTDLKIVEVVLSSELSKKNHELIRQYLIKFVNDTNAVFSNISYPENDSVKAFLFGFLLKWLSKGVIGLLGILFMFSYYQFILTLIQKSFIYQNYQRKSNIAAKSSASGLGVLIFIVYSVLFFMFDYSLLNLIFSLIILTALYAAFSIVITKDVKNQIN